MSTRLVHRPARTTRPPAAPAPRTIEAPPNLPEGKAGNIAMSLLPVAGVMSSVVMMTVVRNSQFAALGAIILVVTVIGSVALLFSQRGKAQRTRRTQREAYLAYVEDLREELSGEERERRERADVLNPPPYALYDIVRDPARLWERRRVDDDFLRVRVGTGEMPVRNLQIAEPGSTVLTPPDLFMLNEASALVNRFRNGTELPLTVPLDRIGNVSVIGPREDCLRVARALLVQTAALHAPDDVAIALAAPGDRMADWEWAKWLPHLLDTEQFDGPVAARRIAPSAPQLARQIGAELRRRASYAAEVRRGLAGRDALSMNSRLLVVTDGHGEDAVDLPRPDDAVGLREMGVTVLHLLEQRVQEPGHVSVRITVDGADVTIEDLRTPEPVEAHGTVDEAGIPFAEGLARMLAPLRLSAESLGDAPLSGPVEFAAMLGINDVARLDLDRLWAPRGERAFLRVPIGISDSHEPVLLDLKESSELGMGPHGLCVGATGSGKSELLRTLVLALVATHPPEDLALVLVDYKGGATFAPFAELPHVAGVITNLENQAGLVERVHSSLAGEVKRRQQALKDAGNVADIGDYAALRAGKRPDLDPLPHLFVVIDEFGELLTAKPDFIDLFLSIGRIGRSIGVHLLLSSQRIEGGKLKGLDTYLSYRLGLRTFSADESRTVLETTDAFHLPPLPGFGYLKVDTSHYARFKAGYVSGGYRGPARRHDEEETGPLALPYEAFNTLAGPDEARQSPEPASRRRETGPTELGIMVDQLTGAAAAVRSIWLPPLPTATALDTVAGPLDIGPNGMRLTGAVAEGRRTPLRVPVGLLDDPARQWQGQWFLDLTVAGGHAAVIGGPQSGKTTLLRTLVLSLALTHTPREIGVYGLDLVGGGLQALSGLPHVGGIAGRADRERAARTVEEVRTMLALREDLFREHGIDSVDQLRTLHAAGRLPELASAEILLVIDGFGALRDDFDELDDAIADILKRGGGYGIHVVAGMLRWNDVRIAIQSNFGTRVELRLNDPGESGIDRKLAETLSPDEPGRVLTDGKLFAQVALPRTDGVDDTTGLGAVLERTARTVRATWNGEVAQPVRVLPQVLEPHSLPGPAAEPTRVPIGLDQSALAPVLLDLFSHDQHLLVLGDSECGKTNLLRTVAHGLVDRYGEDDLVFAVMDPRRSLRGVVPEEFNGGYAYNSKLCAGLSAAITTELEKRLPDENARLEDLEPGNWGKGPRIVVLVDDYDVLTTAGQSPLSPFLPYIPSAVDIGLHFVLTRRVAGASRGMYEPLVQGLRESGASALLMAGDRSEGQLFPGVYASQQAPGRGVFIRRGQPNRLIQTVYAPM
ncbi:type VII secretion protein EccC [Streptomyces filamentosus]|uniref:Type VII secretion protein EccC n=1 Tax=Streptomyces filamentosus TaxID=67294 RepID=A0ABY4UZ41_STRFL|nr:MULTISPECIES: type VII secretion protein EccC [Streptomyces]ESU48024.1 FtsK/SpoIIIE family protein [Streptomyces sp. HCCB10043]MYR78795.1 type VII secretion protein EccC [Streptomyces sp. SID5466]USC49597.1 type VII secretion protein EccC [Streptomyces filamentosus]